MTNQETISAHNRGEDLPIRMREPLEVETVSTDKTERAALLPCPFCGGDAVLVDRPDGPLLVGAFAGCDACDTHLIRPSAREAIAAWNTRAALPSQPATAVQPVVIAWVHEADPHHSISAPQKEQALRDGGASASSVRPYSVAAYVHPSAPAEGGWQPIASAPKDGTRIILAWPGGIWTGHYEARTSNTHLTPWRRDKWGLGDTAHGAAPTHWHPLPAAPSAAQPGGADGGIA